jgi:hypothetical protein
VALGGLAETLLIWPGSPRRLDPPLPVDGADAVGGAFPLAGAALGALLLAMLAAPAPSHSCALLRRPPD